MKRTIRIPIHSFVDVITNSSTVIYVGTHGKTIEYAKELIDTFLKMANSDKTADDLFEFKLTLSDDYKERFAYQYLDNYEGDLTDEQEIYNEADVRFEYLLEHPDEQDYEFGKVGSYDPCYDAHTLVITSKIDDEFTMNLSDKFERLFSIDAERDG